MVDELDACMIWIYMHENLMDDDFWYIYMFMFIYWCICACINA
jgi:hypothetical protein